MYIPMTVSLPPGGCHSCSRNYTATVHYGYRYTYESRCYGYSNCYSNLYALTVTSNVEVTVRVYTLLQLEP